MRILTLLLLSLFIIQCKTKSVTKAEAEEEVVEPHINKNIIDWVGTYSGLLPCDDCRGIQTTVNIKEGLFIEVTSLYLNKAKTTKATSAKFNWDQVQNIISFNDQNDQLIRIRLEDQQITYLVDGYENLEEDIAKQYVLKKGIPYLEGRYWQATEVMGISLNSEESEMAEESNKKDVFLLLKSNGEFSASGGCNQMFGKIEISSKNLLKFSKIAMTEMACDFENYDQQLNDAFSQADSYIILEESKSNEYLEMHLMIGKRAPLAKFISPNYPPLNNVEE